MATYVVSLTVSTDRQLAEDQVMQVARRWAERAHFVQGMTSTSRDEPWLRVQGMTDGWESAEDLGQHAGDKLRKALREQGVIVKEWHAIEILDEDEVRRRSERPVIPPVYTTEQFATAAGIARQRIHQYLSDRRAGKRDDFPDQVLPGLWLQTEADHWIATRKTKPGPTPKAATA